MGAGGYLDKLAAEYGIHFVAPARRIDAQNQCKARRTCKVLLEKHGPGHLRLVFGLINTPANRGNWSSQVLSAVSWLVLNKPELVAHPAFVPQFDQLQLNQMLQRAKDINPSAPTITLAVLLAYELDALVSAILPGKVA